MDTSAPRRPADVVIGPESVQIWTCHAAGCKHYGTSVAMDCVDLGHDQQTEYRRCDLPREDDAITQTVHRTEEVTDAMVDAAARAICTVRYGDWEDIDQFDRNLAIEDAHVALAAALASNHALTPVPAVREYMSGGQPSDLPCDCGRTPDPGTRPDGGCWCVEDDLHTADQGQRP
jgi:hypothetical protein